ncbi:hypothetical protein T10_6547 [Trichinella papuae]|uniref:Uncharacterized protein n=1 Tax=Trichinella papuae TaxID=268474 RepID=A0A0V1MJQ4_9BILA|nr:hypothetical protein T10_6547 [Trichinella papuae]
MWKKPEERRKGSTSPKKLTRPKRSKGVSITSSAAAFLASITRSCPCLEPGDFLPVIRKDLAEAPGLTGPYESVGPVTVSGCVGSEHRMRRVDFQLRAESDSGQPVSRRRVRADVWEDPTR